MISTFNLLGLNSNRPLEVKGDIVLTIPPVSLAMVFNVGQGTRWSLSHTCNTDIWYIQVICSY